VYFVYEMHTKHIYIYTGMLFRKVEDLQFALEEMSIEKADAEVSSYLCLGIFCLFITFVVCGS